MADSTRPAPNPNPNGYPAHPPPANQNYLPLLHRVLALIIGLLVICAAIIFIIKRPVLHLPEFRVDSLSLSNLSVGNGSRLSVAAVARLTARNPHEKVAFSYDHSVAKLYYQRWLLSDTAIQPFSQETGNVTTLTVSFAAAAQFLEKEAAEGVSAESREKRNVEFNLRVFSMIRFKGKEYWRASKSFLKVYCGGLVVGIPANGRPGTLSGGPRRCRVVT